MKLAAGDPTHRAQAIAIVTLLSSYYPFTPLEWDGLASEEKLSFYQLAGDRDGECGNDGERQWHSQGHAGALADADNPPLSENELMSVKVKRVRKKLGLSQADFAARFRINIARLKDIEQGRTRKRPDPALMAYLSVIEREPEAVDRALANDG